MDQIEPKPVIGMRTRPDSNSGTSVWSAMHPNDNDISGPPVKQLGLRKQTSSLSAKGDSAQRRDPIGYFEDNKFGGSYGSSLSKSNYEQANQTPAAYDGNYKPSWSPSSNELLDNAMMYNQNY